MIDINSVTYEQLNNVITDLGQPEFRTKQIFTWLHKNGVSSFDEMTNISKSLREKLSENFYISTCQIEDKYISKIDGTVKYLFKLSDGEYIESVIMKYKYGYTICVSSQVGCKMGCTFCASTLAGFKRNRLSDGNRDHGRQSGADSGTSDPGHFVYRTISSRNDWYRSFPASS